MAEEIKKESEVIMIPVKEYRRLCRKIEKLKLEYKEVKHNSENRYKWWKEEEELRSEAEAKLKDALNVIAQYKQTFKTELGIEEVDEDAESE